MRIAALLSLASLCATGCDAGPGGPAPPTSSTMPDLDEPAAMAGADMAGAAPADLEPQSPPDLTFLSACGHPGDTGNSIGVGRYCMSSTECTGPNVKTKLCTALANGAMPSPSDTYFCTIVACNQSPGFCGENAHCVCNQHQDCLCVPYACH